MLDEKSLNLAGSFSIAAAVLSVPLVMVQLISVSPGGQSAAFLILQTLFSVAYVAISVYVLIMFKRLLNQKASFYDVDRYIDFIIWVNIASAALQIITLPMKGAQETIGTVFLILLVLIGIILVLFGVKLQKCNDDLFGYLKPYSYLTIASGVMIAIYILALFGIIISLICDVILALIFFKSAKLYKEQGPIK
jgi:hypothetical protein